MAHTMMFSRIIVFSSVTTAERRFLPLVMIKRTIEAMAVKRVTTASFV